MKPQHLHSCAFFDRTLLIASCRLSDLTKVYLANNALCGNIPANLRSKLYIRSWPHDLLLTQTVQNDSLQSCNSTSVAPAASSSQPAYSSTVSPDSGQLSTSRPSGSSTNVGAIVGVLPLHLLMKSSA